MFWLWVELAMLVWGLVCLCVGKFAFSANHVVSGARARIMGVLLMLPFPIQFIMGFMIGFILAVENPGAPVIFDAGSEQLMNMGSMGILITCVVSTMLLGLGAGPPPSPSRRTRPMDDDDYDDDRPRKRRHADDEDEDRPRKRRHADEEDDDQPRKRRHADEEDDDQPRKRRHADEEDDDQPRKRRHVDEEDDDRPRKRRPDGDGGDDDDDRPRKRRDADDEVDTPSRARRNDGIVPPPLPTPRDNETKPVAPPPLKAAPEAPASAVPSPPVVAGPIRVACQHCSKQLQISAASLGKAVRCPACKGVFKAAKEADPQRSEEGIKKKLTPPSLP